jgi:hypothetical protein
MSPARTLIAARTALGTGALLAPRTTGKLFLLDPEANPQVTFIGRMWGIRNLALAAGLRTARGGPQLRTTRQVNVAVDVADAIAAWLAWREGSLPAPAAALAGGTAVVATALGVASLGR